MANENNQPVRHAARAVITDDDGKFAVLEVNGGEYFKIPGGGIEEGESPEDAVRREAMEEAGCQITILKKVGEREFQAKDFLNHSVCYLAQKVGLGSNPKFTEEERKKQFNLKWLPFEEAINLFDNAKPQTEFHAHMNERDRGFLMDAHLMEEQEMM